MTKFTRLYLISTVVAAGRLGAQVASPSPLVDPQAAAAVVPGGWMIAEGRANSALQSGFPATAAAGYREILREPVLPSETRQQVTLALVTALMDAGEVGEADTVLKAYDGPRNSAYQLRVGLLAANARRIPQAKAALAAGRVDDLPAPDKGWWYFLQALIAEADNDLNRRNAAYQQANTAAVSELQRVRFMLGEEQARLRRAPLDEARLAVLRQTIEDYQGRTMGYESARTYAAALAILGRSDEAQRVLQRQLAVIPPSERNEADQFRLLLGLIAGEGSVPGRLAFKQLLRDGQKAETQQIALSLLARGAKSTAEREQLRRDLGELIGAPVQHPIIENLLLVRAQTALADKVYEFADDDARTLLERYPGSALKPAALGVRLSVAWETKRYRLAADLIARLRELLATGRERAELGVLLAEAWFRAGSDAVANGADGKDDFRNAADAYEAALHESPPVVSAGVLIFQHVLSDIRAERLDEAANLLDGPVATAAFVSDAVNHWQAEWNLAKELQVRGRTKEAYARVDRLLAGGAPGVAENLRVQFVWLRAKLSFDNDQPAAALRQANELLAALQPAAQLEPAFRIKVTSTALLLKAQALFALNRDDEGKAMIENLRADFRDTAAAQYSYLVQAGHLTNKGDMAGAQGVLISFVDNKVYRNSEYAPVALYEAALNLERQGLDRNLREAYERLVRLVADYPQDELYFHARLKQGDLLRKLNDFAAARQIYDDLINNHGQHPDVLLAEIAKAHSLFAQGANSVVNYESAMTIFERLRDLPSAAVDLRAEAGFMWGYALAKRGQGAKAQVVFWSLVDAFLLEAGQGEALGANGRYWIARSLLVLGQIHEDAGNHDEAQRAYQLIVTNKLGGREQAQAKLARYRANGGAQP